MATGYGLSDRGVGVQVPLRSELSSTSSRPALGPTQFLTEWVTLPLSPGIKRLGREADHVPPTSADVKKTWIYTSTPPYVFMTWYLATLRFSASNKRFCHVGAGLQYKTISLASILIRVTIVTIAAVLYKVTIVSNSNHWNWSNTSDCSNEFSTIQFSVVRLLVYFMTA
jgi:hypothetical protein